MVRNLKNMVRKNDFLVNKWLGIKCGFYSIFIFFLLFRYIQTGKMCLIIYGIQQYIYINNIGILP